MKPTIAVALKWKFDFLIKTYESHFEIDNDLRYWIDIVTKLKALSDQGWYDFDPSKDDTLKTPWVRTAEGFDLGWTTTTAGENFKISQSIASDRLNQILEMLGGPNYLDGKAILDSGCGPGRYVDLMRKMNPKSIVAMAQGQRLIDVLNKRFADDKLVDVVKGTCTDLSSYQDESLDFVLSNRVIHHTSSDLLTMIKDHARVLKKDGTLLSC